MQDNEISLLRLYQSLREEWKVITGIVLLSAGLSVFIAIRTTPIYRAEVTVNEVRNQQSGAGALLGELGNLAGLAGVDASIIRGNNGPARATLQSRRLVEEYVHRNNLLPILFADRWDSKKRDWLDSAQPPTLWLGVDYFTKNVLRIREDAKTGLLIVSCEWHDPQLAANWANGLVSLANELVRQRDIRDSEKNIAYVRTQIDNTNVLEIKQVIYRLIEAEMKTLMLANARQEYAFAIIDPAVKPERHIRPRRSIIAILGTSVGGLLGLFIGGLRQTIKRQRNRAVEI